MSQIFHRSTNTLSRATIFGAVFVIAALGWIAYEIQGSPYVTYAGVRKPQPVPFSHQHHVTGLGREGLRYAIEEMTEPKLMVMNLR